MHLWHQLTARGHLVSWTVVWLYLATFMPTNTAACLAFTGHLIRQFWEISTVASSFCPFPTDGKGAVVKHKRPVRSWCLFSLLLHCSCCFWDRSPLGSAGRGSADTIWRGSLRDLLPVIVSTICNFYLSALTVCCSRAVNCLKMERTVFFLEPVHLHTLQRDSCEQNKHRPCHSCSLLADREGIRR